jgi:hypothetical protein
MSGQPGRGDQQQGGQHQMKGPGPDDWSTARLPPSRRLYIDGGRSFEGIASLIVAKCEITKYWIEPLRDKPTGFPNFDQACFRLRVSNEAFDLFHNAPNGLRGRYWQSPDVGFLATRYLIDALKPKLVAYAYKNPAIVEKKASDMTLDEVRASLDVPSAKVWIREKDDEKCLIISTTDEARLIVPRWEKNEEVKPEKFWRWTPGAGEIEVKGGLIRDGGKQEHVPEIKRDRSCQIHLYGHT